LTKIPIRQAKAKNRMYFVFGRTPYPKMHEQSAI
jgi:hypothetical protein